MNIDFKRLEVILADAAAVTNPAERAAYLDQACGADQDLRAEVERLLAASQEVGDFLETPIQPASEFIAGAETSGPEQLRGIESPGSIIGRYKLLEEIGEGGFGLVYMAEQTEPVQRKVALKVVKAGMDTREVVARFEAERQALALMDHPNIARVFDGGVTQGGRPYFVMELVRGIPITEFCDQRKLSTPERLKLFIQACHAVQHAHQKGIIHRDLKPSNILVTIVDGEPVPKVIDFGVAKALGQKLTEKTLFTGFFKMIGTPAYMSPEQADLSGVDIDTRSDIYSLGVLLYELLTGATPFDKETLAKAALDEIRRMILETEPPKPSTRLRALGEKLPTVAEHRQTEPGALSRFVRGDLDWIVMKCLEKDRRRRYETANSLASDIERHLAREPVLACSPSASYKLCKFASRNKMALGTAALVIVVLVAGTVISVLQTIRATRAERLAAQRLETETEARRLAENARAKALGEASRATAVSEMLQKALDSTGPRAAGPESQMGQLLDEFSASLSGQAIEEPELEASVRAAVGNAYRRLGATDKAQPHLDAALDLRRRLFGEDHGKVAESLLDLAWYYHQLKDDRTAEAHAREALAISQRLNLARRAVQAAAYLEMFLKCLGRFDEAEQIARQALVPAGNMDDQQAPATSGWPDSAAASSAAWLALARVCLDLEEAGPGKKSIPPTGRIFTEAAQLGGVSDPADFEVGEWKRRGSSYVKALRWDMAISAYSRAIALQKYDRSLYYQRGSCYLKLAKFQEMLTDFTRAVEMDNMDSGFSALRALAHLKLGHTGQAMADYLRAIECWRLRIERVGRLEAVGLKGRPHLWSFASSEELIEAGADPAEVRALYEKLEAACRDEVTAIRKRFGPNHVEAASALAVLAQFLQEQRRIDEAEVVWREQLALEKALTEDDNPRVASSLSSLGEVLRQSGKLVEAERAFRDALAIRRNCLANDHPDTTACLGLLQAVLKAQGKPPETARE